VVIFEQMALLAHQLASELKGVVIDDNGRELSPISISQIQSKVHDIEVDMLAGGIVAGSAQARRLFA
jgi:FtsZ-interacting cell division protein ZipA